MNHMNTLIETTPVVHTGLDSAKATLQLDLLGRAHTLPNTAAGHRQLVKLLRAVPGAHVVCEATGGYERAVVAALQARQIPVSVLNPAQVRHFALAQGQRAKNDPLDAGVLSAYGAALRPVATPLPDAALAELRGLVQWRGQLQEQRNALRNHAEHATLDFVKKRLAKLAAHLKQQLEAVETEMAAALAGTRGQAGGPRRRGPAHRPERLESDARTGPTQPGRGGGAGRPGAGDAAERTVGRAAAHRGWPGGGAPGPLHVGRGLGADEGEHAGEVLRQAAGGRQTGQGGAHGGDAKTARADESGAQTRLKKCLSNNTVAPRSRRRGKEWKWRWREGGWDSTPRRGYSLFEASSRIATSSPW